MNTLLTIDLEVLTITGPVWSYLLIGFGLFIMNYIRIKTWLKRLFNC